MTITRLAFVYHCKQLQRGECGSCRALRTSLDGNYTASKRLKSCSTMSGRTNACDPPRSASGMWLRQGICQHTVTLCSDGSGRSHLARKQAGGRTHGRGYCERSSGRHWTVLRRQTMVDLRVAHWTVRTHFQPLRQTPAQKWLATLNLGVKNGYSMWQIKLYCCKSTKFNIVIQKHRMKTRSNSIFCTKGNFVKPVIFTLFRKTAIENAILYFPRLLK